VGVQISHHKACGRRSWGNVRESLAMVDAARADGMDVWADQYPYIATATGLSTMLPPWTYDGGLPALMHRINDPVQLARIRSKVMEDTESGWIDDWGGWKSIVVSFVNKEENRWCEGKSIEEIAASLGKHPVDAMLGLMRSEGGVVGILRFVIDEKDVCTVMKHPAVLIGSDATARAASGPTSNGRPHPRSFGTFPRVLGKYSRDEQVLPLEEAIAKMTGRTAERFNLPGRGLVREGCFADLVIFDPQTVRDAATYDKQHTWAEGIKYVLVNGRPVMENGLLKDITDTAPGRVLRRGMVQEVAH
jgi:N-acyl-D-amino-acid deacylase